MNKKTTQSRSGLRCCVPHRLKILLKTDTFAYMLNNQEISKYTYDDYKNREGYWELINGYTDAMNPSAKIVVS
jgi:hypothetical protein